MHSLVIVCALPCVGAGDGVCTHCQSCSVSTATSGHYGVHVWSKAQFKGSHAGPDKVSG